MRTCRFPRNYTVIKTVQAELFCKELNLTKLIIHLTMNENDFKVVIDNACEKSYNIIIKKTMILFDKGRTPKDILKAGFNIKNRQDFAKGYAICGLYMTANLSLNATFDKSNCIFTDNLKKYKDEKLETFSIKICDYFDKL